MDEKGLKISAMEAAASVAGDMKIPAISGGRNVALTVAQLHDAMTKADWSGTQSQYNALAAKDDDRWYVVTDSIDGHTVALYRGERLITAEPNMVGQFAEDSTEEDWYWWPDGVKTPLPVDPATKRFSFYYPGTLTNARYLFSGELHSTFVCRLKSLERMPLFSGWFGDYTFYMLGKTGDCATFPVVDLRHAPSTGTRGRDVNYLLLNNTACRQLHFANTENMRAWGMVVNLTQMVAVTGLDFSSTVKAQDVPFSPRTAYLEIRNLGKAEDVQEIGFDLFSLNLGDDTVFPGSRRALIDTLLTNSFDRAAAGYTPAVVGLSQQTFDRLTEDEVTAITAKGFTLVPRTTAFP